MPLPSSESSNAALTVMNWNGNLIVNLLGTCTFMIPRWPFRRIRSIETLTYRVQLTVAVEVLLATAALSALIAEGGLFVGRGSSLCRREL